MSDSHRHRSTSPRHHRHHTRSRSPTRRHHTRSRSPTRRHRSHHDRHRSRSPRRSSHHHRSRSPRRRKPSPAEPVLLPFNSPRITKHDYDKLAGVFASYLDIQKNLVLAELDQREARGRFKSFVSHYNHGDLARGWYERVIEALVGTGSSSAVAARPAEPVRERRAETGRREEERQEETEDSDEEIGPRLPGMESKGSRAGPRVPGVAELETQKELQEEDAMLAREDLRFERKMDRKAQKERLEELVPRAEPGTRERQLEKKKEVNEKMRAFREKSPVEEVDEGTIMGGGENESFAARKAAMTRKKNERELRREQLLKARVAEREERMAAVREKEEKTMAMLKQLAARFQ